jgi:CheY-like chemotaxis protein
MIAHELRNQFNPLALIEMNIRSDIKDNEQLQPMLKYMDQLSKIINTCKALISNILSFGQIESGKEELPKNTTFYLREKVASIVDLQQYAANNNGIEITLIIDEAMPEILIGSELLLDFCLVNLISNAVKYADRNSKIIIHVIPEGGHCKISVSNICPDISEEKHEALFRMFETNKRNKSIEGTGIGLYVVDQKIKTVNGSLSLKSKNRITEFSLTFPLVVGKEDDIVKEEPDIDLNLAGIHFLIADDDEMSAYSLGYLLSKMGATNTTAIDGYGVLKELTEKIPNMIILDSIMPRMDGMQTLSIIKNNPKYSNIPVMIITGEQLPPFKEQELKASGVDIIIKPIEKKPLIAAVRRQVNTIQQSLQETNA